MSLLFVINKKKGQMVLVFRQQKEIRSNVMPKHYEEGKKGDTEEQKLDMSCRYSSPDGHENLAKTGVE